VKRYAVGERHTAHQDLHAGAAGRKLAGVVQLSEPDDYAGGHLVMSFAHHRVPMPRARGTLVAFPGWTVHEVTPITRGVRWSLCVNGFGPRLR
jgi:PKHD-type hydroxylase